MINFNIRILSLIIVVFIFGFSCSKNQRKIKPEQLQQRDELYYAVNEEEPYSGKVNTFYENGQKKTEVTLKNGKTHGLSTEWDYNGQKQREVSYKNGKQSGHYKTWYDNGQQEKEGAYKEGKIDGKWIFWYANGQKQKESSYKDGKESGPYRTWYDNGQQEKEGAYKEGKKDGKWIFWYANGQKQKEGSYKDGKEFGEWKLSTQEVIREKKKTIIDDYKSLFQNLPHPGFEVKSWEWISPVEITMPPILDAENLYIITNNELTCIKKNSLQLKWNAEFEGDIKGVESLRDEKLLIIDGVGNHYMLDKAHGNIEWQKAKPATHEKYNKQSPKVIVIDYIRDGRLEQNYYILSHKNLLKLILAGKGDVVAAEEFDDKIDYISDYDYVEKCFYVCIDRKIIKVDLIIL